MRRQLLKGSIICWKHNRSCQLHTSPGHCWHHTASSQLNLVGSAECSTFISTVNNVAILFREREGSLALCLGMSGCGICFSPNVFQEQKSTSKVSWPQFIPSPLFVTECVPSLPTLGTDSLFVFNVKIPSTFRSRKWSATARMFREYLYLFFIFIYRFFIHLLLLLFLFILFFIYLLHEPVNLLYNIHFLRFNIHSPRNYFRSPLSIFVAELL